MQNPYARSSNSSSHGATTTKPPPMPQNSSTALERKLQGFEADLRRQREEARRAAELGQERLRLATLEMERRQQTHQVWQSKLDQLQVDANTQRQVQELRDGVPRLEKEVSFQHQELLQKTQKIQTMKRDHTIQAQKRKLFFEKHQLAVARERHRQAETNNNNHDESTTPKASNVTAEGLLNCLRELIGEDWEGRLQAKWKDVVDAKTRKVQEEAVLERRTTLASLERIQQGYQAQFFATSATDNNANGGNANDRHTDPNPAQDTAEPEPMQVDDIDDDNNKKQSEQDVSSGETTILPTPVKDTSAKPPPPPSPSWQEMPPPVAKVPRMPRHRRGAQISVTAVAVTAATADGDNNGGSNATK